MKDYTTLMQRRIRRILLICNNYDSFSLEEDGRIELQIAREYGELNLSNPPAIHRVESTHDAVELLQSGERFDLAITMYNVGDLDVSDFARRSKEIDPGMPVVLLTAFSREIYKMLEEQDSSCIDYTFCWNNSTDLIIAIIKLLEDRLNAEHDILEYGVRTILLVEDSVRYYSTYLPLLYNIIFRQNTASLSDALNETEQTARKRARPKVLLATCYSEAVDLYRRYKDNLLGVISDVGFVVNKGDLSRNEKSDAGVDLCNLIREDDPLMPFLMQSSQESMRPVAESLGVGFIHKRSKMLTTELREYIEREFCFGDFVVLGEDGLTEVARAGDLYTLEKMVKTLQPEYFRRMSDNNRFSKWLYARGLFDLGDEVRRFHIKSEEDLEVGRMLCVTQIHDFRVNQGLGVVAQFNPATYNNAIRFARLGDGSLGGKARGLAFLNHILQKYNLYNEWEGVRVLVPRTLVLTTSYFDRFIRENGLKYVINADISDADILSEFVASTLPQDLTDALRVFIRGTRKPLAIRSSSKLEDSYYQPFAGVYSTYMIPHVDNEDQQLRLLGKAIKSVYASVYFAQSKGYITATANVISEEKMGIVIQEICGSMEGEYFFPTLSGVARSVNFYPVGNEKAEDGICKLAYGLGKAVVDGEQVLRFSPNFPKHVMQTSTPELTMTETQRAMFALDLKPETFKTSVDDSVNLARIDIHECSGFKSFSKVVSTWDNENMRIVDSAFPQGPKFVTFAQMLRYDTFPVAKIIRRLLDIAKQEMKCNVEIEFAADLEREFPQAPVFNVLQIRPISTESSTSEVDWSKISSEGALLTSGSALGTGWIEGVQDVVYLRREAFDTLRTREMAAQVAAINAKMRGEGRGYVLIGYGRWGTCIPSLGVPVKWSDISEAKAIVECCLDHFRVDPSQGTHFFQNLTSFNVGYVNVNEFVRPADGIDFDLLDSMPAVEETALLRWVRFEKPLGICIDGRESRAQICA